MIKMRQKKGCRNKTNLETFLSIQKSACYTHIFPLTKFSGIQIQFQHHLRYGMVLYHTI